MSHKDIYANYIRMFSSLEGKTFQWFQNGKSSIRLRIAFEDDMIFTYKSPKDWTLETVDNWMRRTHP